MLGKKRQAKKKKRLKSADRHTKNRDDGKIRDRIK